MEWLFVKLCLEALQISKPVEFRIRPIAKRGTKGLAAYCTTRFVRQKVSQHIIVVNLDMVYASEYSLETIIAHELIHACQIEHGFFCEKHHHNAQFQGLAKHLRNLLKSAGYKLGPLYDPKIDDT